MEIRPRLGSPKGIGQESADADSEAALGLNRTVGIDRVEIWNDGARFTFDPAAYDGEHDTDDVIAIERPYAPAVNGHDPKVTS